MHKRGIFVLVSILVLLISVDARIPEQTTPGGGIIRTSTSSLQCSDGTIFGSCNSGGFLCVADTNLLNEDDVINLVNSKEYLFFGETNCFNPVLSLDGRRLPFAKTGKRVASQFISNGERKEFTLECSGVQEEFNNAYLGEVRDAARLYKDCQLCNCPEDEAEKLQEYVLVSNLEGVNSLSTESYRNVGRAKIAANTKNLGLCRFENSVDSVTCVQQVFDFNCKEDLEDVNGFDEAFEVADEIVNCRQEIFDSSDIAVNPNFGDGRLLSRGGSINEFGNVFYDDWDLRPGDDVSRSTNKCDAKSTYHTDGIFGLFRRSSTYRFDVDYGQIFKSGVSKHISGEYNLLNTFSQDLLCGYDDYWHLCDREGIKTFDNGEMYYCSGGIWIKL